VVPTKKVLPPVLEDGKLAGIVKLWVPSGPLQVIECPPVIFWKPEPVESLTYCTEPSGLEYTSVIAHK
jgi:hypothetical protein